MLDSSAPSVDEVLAGFAVSADFSMEKVVCYECGSQREEFYTLAQDDLTGKKGTFRFSTCLDCGLRYQNPRVSFEAIPSFYDSEYISHRKVQFWAPLQKLFDRAMDSHDRAKLKLVEEYVSLKPGTEVLDVGCAVGSFLAKVRRERGVNTTGVDFKDFSKHPLLEGSKFLQGQFFEQDLPKKSFDLITMWHFLEHDYDPLQSLAFAGELIRPGGRIIIEVPRLDSRTADWFGERWPGLQAPQHTILFDKDHLLKFVEKSGLKLEAYLPYGAFPSYFYIFTGVAFKMLRGQGLNLKRAAVPYFLGETLLKPALMFERKLNLAMQTVVCSSPH